MGETGPERFLGNLQGKSVLWAARSLYAHPRPLVEICNQDRFVHWPPGRAKDFFGYGDVRYKPGTSSSEPGEKRLRV